MKIKIKRKAPAIERFDGEWRFLSNFWEEPNAPLMMDGCEYATLEHAYQASKTREPIERRWIRLAPTPGIAKQIGKTVRMRPDWNAARVGVMRALVAEKFKVGSLLAERLLATGDAKLVEGNHWGDKFWGVCNGVGENWLGRLLMERHAELKHA